MLYFPQLSSGAIVQYPILKQRISRTLISSYLDGSALKFLDPGWGGIKWEITLTGLTSQELAAIETLFQATEGRLGNFTLLDPTANLLAWSEKLTSPAWSNSPLVQLTEGIADPVRSYRATRVINTGQTFARIQQTISAPSWFHYCFSCYARSQQPTNITLFRSTTANADRKTLRVGTGWDRFYHSGKSQDSEESTNFGVELDAGATVEIFGLQVQAQPGASSYTRTLAQSGVYPKSRFEDDILAITTHAPDQHSCTIRIVAQI